MLPAAYRLTHRQDFTLVVRRGRRSGRRRLVVHAFLSEGATAEPAAGHGPTDGDSPVGSADRAPRQTASATPTRDLRVPRVGFVVSKAVGGSVVRHQVARRLRHLMRDRIVGLPPGSDLVVRALSPAATASSAELGADLDAALRRLVPTAFGGETG